MHHARELVGRGAYETSFSPALWRIIGPDLPTGAALSAFKSVAYFDSGNIGGRVVVLVAYVVVGAGITVLVGWRRGPNAPELEIAAATAT